MKLGEQNKRCEPGCQCRKHAPHTPEMLAVRGAAISKGKRGKRDSEPAQGWYIDKDGYRVLTGMQDHPLATADVLGEHRKILYDKIGPGVHLCHWCSKSIEWGGSTKGIYSDHVDNDHTNNDPANLVPSCFQCNISRGQSWFKGRSA